MTGHCSTCHGGMVHRGSDGRMVACHRCLRRMIWKIALLEWLGKNWPFLIIGSLVAAAVTLIGSGLIS